MENPKFDFRCEREIIDLGRRERFGVEIEINWSQLTIGTSCVDD